MAEAMSCTELHNMAKAFALQNFPEVSEDKHVGPFRGVWVPLQNNMMNQYLK